MSLRRLLLTATAMAGIGLLLHAAAPGRAELVVALTHPQRLADTAGPAAVVLCLAGTLAGLVWVWGSLGLLLTAAGALPGAAGAAGRRVVRLVLPAGARRAAALTLGVSIGLNSPVLGGVALGAPATAPAVSATTPAVATISASPIPDWPAPRPAAAHVVLPGECLWTIAAGRLRADASRVPTDAEIATAVQAWWRVNARVIGPDPDLLLPGQVLQAPTAP